MRKLIIGGLLSLLFVVTLLPTTAFAQPSISFGGDQTYLEGQIGTVTINYDNPVPSGHIQLTFKFNKAIFTFMSVKPAGVVEQWERFTYRYSEIDATDNDPAYSVLTIMATADVPDGNNPGDVFLPTGEIFRVQFLSTTNLYLIGQCCHLYWHWEDCSDNTVRSPSGSSMYIVDDLESILPEGYCTDDPEIPIVSPPLQLQDGQLCLLTYGESGDINLNGMACDIGDLVLFANYFIYGPEAWEPYYENRVLASDYNDDGQPATIQDLVFLKEIIMGERDFWGRPFGQ